MVQPSLPGNRLLPGEKGCMKLAAFDVETHPIAAGRQAPPVVCGAWAFLDGTPTTILPREAHLDWLGHWLREGGAVCGHYIAFDLATSCATRPELTRLVWDAYATDRVFDTMLREKLLDIARGEYKGWKKRGIRYDLLSVSRRHFDNPRNDKGEAGWRLRYHELEGVPIAQWPEDARRYVIADAEDARAVFMLQEQIGRPRNLFLDQFRRSRASWWQTLTSTWGFHTDAEKVAALERETRAEHASIEREAIAAGLLHADKFTPAGVRSRDVKRAAALIEAAFLAAGKEPPRTAAGKVSTSADACIRAAPRLENEEPRAFKAFSEWRKWRHRVQGSALNEKIRKRVEATDAEIAVWSSFFRWQDRALLPDYGRLGELSSTLSKDLPLLRQNPVHTRYDLAVTGRSTSSADEDDGTGGNTQNMGRDSPARACFTPRPGFVFARADFGKLELCTLAQYEIDTWGDSALADALNAGLDPHLMVAADICGVPYEEALRRLKAGDQEIIQMREAAKPANFGFPGGLGADSFVEYARTSYGVLVSSELAHRLKKQWRDTWRLQRYLNHMGRLVEAPGREVILPRSGRVRGGCGYTDGCNTIFQGSGSDVANAAGFLISRACYADPSSPLYGSRIVNFVHDEFIVETPEGPGAAAAAEELSRLMVAAAADWIPNVKIEAEPLLMASWSKKAKPIRDAQGVLQVWRETA